MEHCSLCHTETDTVFNIGFAMAAVCDNCANAITLQNIHWLIQGTQDKRSPEKKDETRTD